MESEGGLQIPPQAPPQAPPHYTLQTLFFYFLQIAFPKNIKNLISVVLIKIEFAIN